MANTTFKGPVRSQNGFQEWNGSAWVPVAGGGGGGGSAIYVPNGTTQIILPVPTAPGQQINYVSQVDPVDNWSDITFTPSANPAVDGSVVYCTLITSINTDNLYPGGPGSLTVNLYTSYNWTCTASYTGTIVFSGSTYDFWYVTIVAFG